MKFISELSKETLICSELKVKDYKELLKCSFGDEPNQLIFIETLTDIFSKLTNKPQEYFKEELSVVDLFCLLLDLKINSHGDSCMLSVVKDDKQMSLELNLEYVKNEITDLLKPFTNSIVEHKDVRIVLDCPTVNRLFQQTDEDCFYFIKQLIATNKILKIQTNEQAKALCNKVSPKVFLKLNSVFDDLLKTLSEHNFLSRYGINKQKLQFIPSIESLIWFTKLIFNEPLDVFYDNLFYLGHIGHIDLEYVNELSPGEYRYMVKKLEETLHAQNPQSEPSSEGHGDFEEDGFFEEPV